MLGNFLSDIIQTMKCFALESFNSSQAEHTKINRRLNFNPGLRLIAFWTPTLSTTELQKPLPTTWARVQYIYINEIVLPVKYKGILIIIFGIYTRCHLDSFTLFHIVVFQVRFLFVCKFGVNVGSHTTAISILSIFSNEEIALYFEFIVDHSVWRPSFHKDS